MFLIVGLGNPGSEYENNRHNIGFMAADSIVRRYSFSPFKTKFSGEIAEGNVEGKKVLVLKPSTFMNDSGRSVIAAVNFYKLVVGDLVVLHDDLDLPVGKIKAKTGGGAGGHNGLKSIDAHCSSDYMRVRFGIGRPQTKEDVVNYVLGNFSKADRQVIDDECDDVADALPVLLSQGSGAFLNRLALMRAG